MIEIYNENMELIDFPNLALGWLESSTRIEHHEAVEGVEEVWHYETIREYSNGGKDVEKVIDVPGVEARPAWDEEIGIQIFHPYTDEELKSLQQNEVMSLGDFTSKIDTIDTATLLRQIEERLSKMEELYAVVAEKLGISMSIENIARVEEV